MGGKDAAELLECWLGAARLACSRLARMLHPSLCLSSAVSFAVHRFGRGPFVGRGSLPLYGPELTLWAGCRSRKTIMLRFYVSYDTYARAAVERASIGVGCLL